MKRLHVLSAVIGTLAVALCCAVPATAVTVSGVVVLDGVNDPFTNLDAGTRTYNFTDGLNFDPGGKIEVWDHTNTFGIDPPVPPDQPTTMPITLNFAPGTGGMSMGADGYIDVMLGYRGGAGAMTFNMNDNDITGTGSINNCVTDGSCSGMFGGTAGSMNVVINSSADVSLKDIIIGSRDANGGSLEITAGGHVDISGKILTADPAGGGNDSKDINIKAASMKINDIDTGSGRQASARHNGNVTLTALAPPGYDPANAAGNTPANVIELNGLIDTHGLDVLAGDPPAPAPPEQQHTDGKVTVTAVKVILGPEFESDLNPFQPAPGLDIHVGASDLFMDMAAGDFSATGDVQFTRPVIPEPSTLLLLVCGALGLAARRRTR